MHDKFASRRNSINEVIISIPASESNLFSRETRKRDEILLQLKCSRATDLSIPDTAAHAERNQALLLHLCEH